MKNYKSVIVPEVNWNITVSLGKRYLTNFFGNTDPDKELIFSSLYIIL